jgi:hypothetical protein
VKGRKTQTSKKEGRESKKPDVTGSMRGEKECKRKENDGEIQTWEGGERKQDGRRERMRKRNAEKDIWKRSERTEKERGGG